jgi:hypothetical protein
MLILQLSNSSWVGLHSHSLARTKSVSATRKATASEGKRCVSNGILIKEMKQKFRNVKTIKQQILDLISNV